MRDVLERIYRAGLDPVRPDRLIRSAVSVAGHTLRVAGWDGEVDLRGVDRIVVIGAGKASASMALALEEALGERIAGGTIATKAGHGEPLERIEVIEAGHPVPDAASRSAARAIIRHCRAADAGTLVIGLISGGGSALLAAPLDTAGRSPRPDLPRLDLDDKRRVTELLLASGATIREMNCVRKHLSQVKGGRLAALIHPARSLNLILSDVVGDRLDTIASGLTAADATTYADALEITDRYGVTAALPTAARRLLQAGRDGRLPETPKPGACELDGVHNVLLGNNLTALTGARAQARALGWPTLALASQIVGEAREVAKVYLAIGSDIARHGVAAEAPCCVIGGGETTVTLRGDGTGGRSQEMALAFLMESAEHAERGRLHFLAASTDGTDGPTDAAGAFADPAVYAAARRLGLTPRHYLDRNDSYTFFDRAGGLLRTGPTRTNVGDLQVLLITDR